MYELLNGLISIFGGVYFLMLASGKVKANKPEFVEKYNKAIKMMAYFLISYGVFSSIKLFG
jgi:hypothetical protein